MRFLTALALLLVVSGGASCATIVKGTSQPVTIYTNPAGAMVYVDQRPVGPSPVTVSLTHDAHVVSASMNGYQPGFAQLTAGFSGWSLFFFPLGTIIDAVTGAITTLDQESVMIQLFTPGTGPAPAPGYPQPGVPPARPAIPPGGAPY